MDWSCSSVFPFGCEDAHGSGKGDLQAEAEGGGELAQGGEAQVAGVVLHPGDDGFRGADLGGQFRLNETLVFPGLFQHGGELAAIGSADRDVLGRPSGLPGRFEMHGGQVSKYANKRKPVRWKSQKTGMPRSPGGEQGERGGAWVRARFAYMRTNGTCFREGENHGAEGRGERMAGFQGTGWAGGRTRRGRRDTRYLEKRQGSHICEQTRAVGSGVGEEALEEGEDAGGVAELAFPDDDDAPAAASETAQVPPVVRDVPREFVGPELPVGLGGGGDFTVLVPVPETAVDEDDGAVFGQDDVGLAGEVLHVEPEAAAGAV